ncbi:MAG: GNAT family N-acetyltransferase [Planctomycetes bacterium]|nr:GNAT family N-acetyltransferase [Planctomycetota bacterium]
MIRFERPIGIGEFARTAGEPAFERAVEGFDCGLPELDAYLKEYALANDRNDSAKCYVVAMEGRILGYYCLAAASIEFEEAPARVVKGLAHHDVPAVLLARLAVDRSVRGQGLGSSLLKEALLRTARVAELVGCRVLLVHVKDDAARRFYMNIDFQPLPGHELHLYLLLKDLRRTLRGLRMA